MLWRDTPWNPSQPAMKSHSSVSASAALVVGHLRRGRSDVVKLDIFRFFDDASAVALPDPVEFLGDRGLPVRPHWPAGMRLRVDEERLAVLPDDPAAVVRMTFAIHAFAGARFAQHLNGTEFKHPGADAFQHIRFRLPLDDDAVDSMAVQQMREEQASRTAADNRDLSPAHACSPSMGLYAAANCSRAR